MGKIIIYQKNLLFMKCYFNILLFLIPFTVVSQTLHLYSGKDNNLYLGCLNCSEFDQNSVWNNYGTYGNKFSQKSIWNEYGTYGSLFSSESPWSEFSTNPPVIVDKEGNFYGYLTVNKFYKKRAEFELALYLYQYHKLIREDLSSWYKKIFE